MKRLVIDTGAIKGNIGAIKKRAETAAVIADLSCDGQGLGLLKAAEILRAEGISNFAVYEVEDAEKLRRNGFVDEHILMLHGDVSLVVLAAVLPDDLSREVRLTEDFVEEHL